MPSDATGLRKGERIYILGHNSTRFLEDSHCRSGCSPATDSPVAHCLFYNIYLSTSIAWKRHGNLLCDDWRWIVITPQEMQMLLSGRRPVLPPAYRLWHFSVVLSHVETYASHKLTQSPVFVNWTPNLSVYLISDFCFKFTLASQQKRADRCLPVPRTSVMGNFWRHASPKMCHYCLQSLRASMAVSVTIYPIQLLLRPSPHLL
jgi:hypothetical protein